MIENLSLPQRMFVWQRQVKIARCEYCGKQQKFVRNEWPSGWSQCGHSKYGNRYLKSGIAWWCPEHIERKYLERLPVPEANQTGRESEL